MRSDDLPAWCADYLGAGPVAVLFERRSISTVSGYRLADGREVVVKAREDNGRAVSCVAAQSHLAERGFPCARPLTPVVFVDGWAVHAEEYRPGGAVLAGDSPAAVAGYATVFARLMGELSEVHVEPPLPSPRWVRWDHGGPGLWPEIPFLDERDQTAVPLPVVEAARRSRARLLVADLPAVLGHADFEAQNLTWRDGGIHTIHDWDSLAWQPEAALVGAAAAVFPNATVTTLAPLASSALFLATYQQARRRPFTAEEHEVAWAAGLWTATHNARWEALHAAIAHSCEAVRTQAEERLRRAGA